MRQGGGSPVHRRSPRKRKTGVSIIVNVTRREVSLGFALKSTKLPFPGDTRRAGRALHNHSEWLSTTMASPGKISRGGVRPFADNASTSRAGENRGRDAKVGARGSPVDWQVNVCGRYLGGYPRGGRGFLTFRTEWMRNVRLYASHFPRLSLCYGVENPAFLNFCL